MAAPWSPTDTPTTGTRNGTEGHGFGESHNCRFTLLRSRQGSLECCGEDFHLLLSSRGQLLDLRCILLSCVYHMKERCVVTAKLKLKDAERLHVQSREE